VLNLVFEALNRISQKHTLAASTQIVVSLLFHPFLHCYPLFLTFLTNSLMFVVCLEALYNGDMPWEEVNTHARGEEEERAGRKFS
jgi:hypothetical protein